jgi:hypothetical protein
MTVAEKLRFKRLEQKIKMLEENVDLLVKALNDTRIVKDVNNKLHLFEGNGMDAVEEW